MVELAPDVVRAEEELPRGAGEASANLSEGPAWMWLVVAWERLVGRAWESGECSYHIAVFGVTEGCILGEYGYGPSGYTLDIAQ